MKATLGHQLAVAPDFWMRENRRRRERNLEREREQNVLKVIGRLVRPGASAEYGAELLATIARPELATGATLTRGKFRGRQTLFVHGRHPIINVELRPHVAALKEAFKVEEVRIG